MILQSCDQSGKSSCRRVQKVTPASRQTRRVCTDMIKSRTLTLRRGQCISLGSPWWKAVSSWGPDAGQKVRGIFTVKSKSDCPRAVLWLRVCRPNVVAALLTDILTEGTTASGGVRTAATPATAGYTAGTRASAPCASPASTRSKGGRTAISTGTTRWRAGFATPNERDPWQSSSCRKSNRTG